MVLDFVNVNVRIKPPPRRRSRKSSALQVISTNPAVLLSVEKKIFFNFDNIFSENSSQEDVYSKTVKPLVEKVKEGYNCTIFAYGQTGTGKTYTMGTNPKEDSKGLISRALDDFFSSEKEQTGYDVYISFMEIYNEKVFDLLKNDSKDSLSLKGMRIEGLSTEKVYNIHEAKHFLELGGRNRHTGETKQNLFSSRSHAIFSIYFAVYHGDRQTYSKLNLVDLAGSESVKKTGTQGNTFQEGISINKGLLSIGQVMTALSANLPYVPYRQSMITTILQDSLNRNNYISLIACVKCGREDYNESIQTLEFTQRVKKMKNKPKVNEVLTRFKAENPEVFENIRRISSTPVKRFVGTPLKPQFKKPRELSVLNNISEPASTVLDNSKSVSSLSSASNTEPTSTVLDNSKSVSSLSSASNTEPASTVLDNSKSVSSLSSASNTEFGSNFSPVIRKYMSELEITIIDKLQTVIQNTLKRRTRSNTRQVAGNHENTPKFSWNQIQHKVSRLVQEEVLQFTKKTSRVTSSPLEHEKLAQAKKILTYNSPVSVEETTNRISEKTSEQNMSRKSTQCVSPINSSSPINVDIIFKKPTVPVKTKMQKSFISPNENRPPRRSARISVRQNLLENSFSSDPNNTISTRQLPNFKTPISCECKIRKLTKSKKTKLNMLKKDSPQRKRTMEILEVLNRGDKRQLQKLSTIGPKTAERILVFRQFKGELHSINELAEMPGWSTTIYQNFIDQNFLKV